MKSNYEDIRNFLLKNGLYQTLSTLEVEMKTMEADTRAHSKSQNADTSNPVLNLSFGENESLQPRDSSFKQESHLSVRNNFENQYEKSQSNSNTISINSSKKVPDLKSQKLIEPKLSEKKIVMEDPTNPFGLLTNKKDESIKKDLSIPEEDKFSFGAENEGEGNNEFDSFSKSHNNKYSKNELDDNGEDNVFGNSFDYGLENVNEAKTNPKNELINKKRGNGLLIEGNIETRPKSEIMSQINEKKASKNEMSLFKSDVKSIDSEPWPLDMRAVANKRSSQGMTNMFGNNRGINKQLFVDTEVTFPSPTKTSITNRKSNSSNTSSRSTVIKPEYSDSGRLNSNRKVRHSEQ